MKNICQKFFEETCRIEDIIHLPGALGDGEASDCLIEFFQDNDDDFIKAALGELPPFMKDKNVEDVGDMERWALSEYLAEYIYMFKKNGFLIQFATPVFQNVTETGSSFSWGYYHTKWLYGETFEQALEKGFEWVESCRKKEREEAGI